MSRKPRTENRESKAESVHGLRLTAYKNLRAVRTHEEAVERGRAGGKKRSSQKQRMKTLKEIAEAVLESRINENLVSKIEEFCPEMATRDATMALAMVVSMARQAIEKGDGVAFKLLRETAGQDPVSKHDITTAGKPLNRAFAIVPEAKKLEDWIKNGSG